MSKIYSYLDNLKFDPDLKKGVLAKYLTNIRLVTLIVISIIISGIFSFINLPRRLNPEINIPIIVIGTALPGASPEDVERLITIPIENELSGLKDVKQITSDSNQGFSNIIIEFNSGVDTDKAQSDAKTLVDNVNDLPEDATTPSVKALDFEDQAVISFAISSKDSTTDLIKHSEELKNILEKDGEVDRVTLSGQEIKEIQILIRPEILNRLNINTGSLVTLISGSLKSFPAGNLENSKLEFSLSIDPTIKNIDDIRNTRLVVNGTNYKLSDLAEITERSKPISQKAFFAFKNNPAEESVNFDIFKTRSAEIDAASKKFRSITDNYVKNYPELSISYKRDFGKEIDDQFRELENNFRDTIILVFVVLLIFLGIRQAIIASSTIPLTILNTFFVMDLINLDLSFLSLFALILALGLVVDDTIVVISAMTNYFKKGRFTAEETGLLVWHDFIVPIWTTTITTIWSFLPLLLATGIIGEFIKPIPIVVSVSLISSTAIAVLITLPLMITILSLKLPFRVKALIALVLTAIMLVAVYSILPKNIYSSLSLVALILVLIVGFITRDNLIIQSSNLIKRYTSQNFRNSFKNYIAHGFINIDNISIKYQHMINSILLSRYRIRQTLAAVIIFSVFSYALVPMGFVVNEFFPKGDSNLVFVNIELPSGTNTKSTEAEINKIANELKDIPDLDFLTASAGSNISGDGTGSSGSNLGSITLNLIDKNDKRRIKSALDIVDDINAKYKNYLNGKISASSESGGPPAGKDIEISLLGDDLSVLEKYSDQVITYLTGRNDTYNVEKSIKQGTSKITFIPDNFKLAKYSVSTVQIGQALRILASGNKIDEIEINNEDVDITLRYYNTVPDLNSLNLIKIQTSKGPINLSELGYFTLKTNPTTIRRIDQKRQVTISAGVKPGFNISQINSELENFVDSKLNLPSGYTRKTGGVNEENQKSLNSIFQAMILSSLLILITMVVQFKSYRQALIVMGVIPLAISGVFIIFAITHTPLSFPALIGVLALFGIVVTHSMVMVDKITKNVRLGIPLIDSIAEGSASRLEPVALTTLTSIVGLIPITLSDPIWQGLGGAIISGLLFSGIIMLLFIPVIYYIVYRSEFK